MLDQAPTASAPDAQGGRPGNAPAPPLRTNWLQIGLLLAAGVVAAFHNGKGPIALPAIRAEFGLSLEAVAWVLSAFPIVGGLVGAGMGLVVSRLGARATVLVGLLLLAAASAAGSFAPGLAVLALSRVVEGFGMLAVSIAAPALLEQICDHRDRPIAFSIWSTFMPLGMAVAMMAAPLLTLTGWRGLWLAMAVVAVAAALLVRWGFPAVRRARAQPERHAFHDLAETVKASGPRLLAAIFLSWAVVWAVLTGFLPTLLVERAGVSVGAAGMLTAMVGASTILGNLLVGPLLRFGIRRWALLAAASGVVALCGVGIFDQRIDPRAALGLSVALTLVGGMIPSCLLGAAAVYAPSRHLIAATLGLVMQGANLGLIIGPAAVGAVVSAFGWGGARLVMVPPALLSIIFALRLRRIHT
jgi:MFS family permease